MNKPSQLSITTPTPDFSCYAKTAPSTFTLKIEATGDDQTCLHCGFAKPNAEVVDVVAFAELLHLQNLLLHLLNLQNLVNLKKIVYVECT